MLLTKFRFNWSSSFGGEDLKKSTNQKQEFLPSFSSFCWEVSEEKIKMRKVNGRQVMAKAHIDFDKVS
jgi:hypothetical protein